MKFIAIIIFSLFFNFSVLAYLIKPDPSIKLDELIKIQLKALKKNNSPYQDAGISQAW